MSMEIFASIIAFVIFVGVTIAHYMKPRSDANKDSEWIWKKIPEFSYMSDGVVYDPRQAHALIAYHFATFKQKHNGEMPHNPYPLHNIVEKCYMEKVACKLHDDKEIYFILYWWRGCANEPHLYVFDNKQSFLDDIYNHWGAELYEQLSENFGCEKTLATA